MKHKTLQQYTEQVLKVIRYTNDEEEIKAALERVLKDAYTRGYNNRITNETRWP